MRSLAQRQKPREGSWGIIPRPGTQGASPHSTPHRENGSRFAHDFSGVPAHGGTRPTADVPAVQMLPGGNAGTMADPASIGTAASMGTSGPEGPLPFADRI